MKKINIEYLKERLRNTTYAPPLQEVNFEYGFNTNQLRKIVKYWINDYKWEKREKLLNSVPHFRTKISGLYIHFIHLKPDPNVVKTKKVIPIILLHGWPGSVKEFYKVFPLLTIPRPQYDYVFEVIAPSLPGYGFSEAATKPGLNPAQIALIMKKLMNRLGFEKFYVQGGDWGSIIGNIMVTLYPQSTLGFHSNLCSPPITLLSLVKTVLGSFCTCFTNNSARLRLYPLSDLLSFIMLETGYLHLQATKPDTVGVALMDSPAGLMAYILEKFSTWENENRRNLPDGGLSIHKSDEKNYSIDDLLDNVMIYWITGSITSAMRLYKEAFSPKTLSMKLDSIPTDVPTVCAHYPQDLLHGNENILRDKYRNLVHMSYMPKGGHFAAFEQPELFSEDLWKGICIIKNFAENLKNAC